ncbi:MAG TPA: hypothetical protein VHY58_01105 [Streptosporangiaceae bacterium]|jgi:hypothetical protein|nr:hypothetical protein [Streptosporangiaceae bacterium]
MEGGDGLDAGADGSAEALWLAVCCPLDPADADEPERLAHPDAVARVASITTTPVTALGIR